MKNRTDLWNDLVVIGARVDALRAVVQKGFPPGEAVAAAQTNWERTTEVRNALATWAMEVKLAAIRGQLDKGAERD